MTDRFAILAHRGNIAGPTAAENTLAAVRTALERGWGVETDLRRESAGRFYVSHDPSTRPSGLSADGFCSLFRQFPDAEIALNLKEPGFEHELVAYLEAQQVIAQAFLFDMELVEPVAGATAARLRRLHPTVRLGARVSDRGEPLDRALAVAVASVIWVDEFDRAWCTQADIRRLRDAGRRVYAVSPELHGAPPREARARWRDLIHWGVNGICTDHPAELEAVLGTTRRREAA